MPPNGDELLAGTGLAASAHAVNWRTSDVKWRLGILSG